MEKWELQENRIVERLSEYGDACHTIASGRFWHSKADARLKGMFKIEAKTSGACDDKGEYIILKNQWLEKIDKEAKVSGEMPVLAISFNDDVDYYILKLQDIKSLVDIDILGIVKGKKSLKLRKEELVDLRIPVRETEIPVIKLGMSSGEYAVVLDEDFYYLIEEFCI